MREIKKSTLYRHFKNRYYFVLDVAKDSETQKEVVVYFPLYKEDLTLFIRPLKMFLENIDETRVDKDINQIERFLEVDSFEISQCEKANLLNKAKSLLKGINLTFDIDV